MKCVIYKSARKADTYLYVEREADFTRVPETLLELLGQMEQVMMLELTADRQLAQADAQQVHELLQQQGYYLQMPPPRESALQ